MLLLVSGAFCAFLEILLVSPLLFSTAYHNQNFRICAYCWLAWSLKKQMKTISEVCSSNHFSIENVHNLLGGIGGIVSNCAAVYLKKTYTTYRCVNVHINHEKTRGLP